MYRLIVILLCVLTLPALAQHDDRIAELYSLLGDEERLASTTVEIYDYKLARKGQIRDSTMVARIMIAEAGNNLYDTIEYTVTEYEMIQGAKIPVRVFKYNDQWQLTEAVVVDEQRNELSKVFYKYKGEQLVSEEAFTGYAYLDQPRKLSIIDYTYERGHLVEKNKKYSLNGVSWIQTWQTSFDEAEHPYRVVENVQHKTTTWINEFQEGKMTRSEITRPDGTLHIKNITYHPDDRPYSVYVFQRKNKKPLRLTRYYYYQ